MSNRSSMRGLFAALAALTALALPAVAHATPAPTPLACSDMDMALGSCSLTFPDTAVGDSSTIAVTVTSSFGGPVTIDPAASDPTFTVDSDTCSTATLNAGDTCEFDVTFTPLDDGISAAHAMTATLQATVMGGPAPINLDATQHSGAGVPSYTGGIAPAAGSFGTVLAGTTADQTFTITGTSTDPLQFSGPSSLSGADAADYAITADTCASATLSLGQTCTITVQLAPGAASASRSSAAQVDVASNADTPISAPLSGTITAVAKTLSVSPPSTDAGSVTVGDHADQTFTYTNTGNVALSLTGATVTGAGVAATADACSATVAVAATCAVTVRWTPTAPGALSATVAVGGDATAGATLTGTAVDPPPAPTTTTTETSTSTTTTTTTTAPPPVATPTPTSQPSTHTVPPAGLYRPSQLTGPESTPVFDADKIGKTIGDSVPMTDLPARLDLKRSRVVVIDSTSIANQIKAELDRALELSLGIQPDDQLRIEAYKIKRMESGENAQGENVLLGMVPARAAAAGSKPKLLGTSCKAGRCTLRIRIPKTPGLYGMSFVVKRAATGAIDQYGLATIVRPRLAPPSTAPRCVTLGQGAATNTIKFGVSGSATLTWSLAAATRQPKRARGCSRDVKWPALKASATTLAAGTVAGTGTSRTTSMAKVLTRSRLAKLKPGFYRVRFAASAAGLVTPADWWIQVLPREVAAGS